MNERVRLEYLEAMGVDSLAPRFILPYAQRSSQCVLPVQVAQKAAPISPAQALLERSGASMLEAMVEPTSSDPIKRSLPFAETLEPEVPITPKAVDPTPHFALSIICSDVGVLVVDGASDRSNASAYKTLVSQLLFAITHQYPQIVELGHFIWPVTSQAKIEQGERSARGALRSYLLSQMDKSSAHSLLILGDDAAQWSSTDPLPKGEILTLFDRSAVVAESGWQMLKNPAVKIQAWRQLQPMVEHYMHRND